MAHGELIQLLEIPQAAARVALTQHQVEARVALSGVQPAVFEGPVHGEQRAWVSDLFQERIFPDFDKIGKYLDEVKNFDTNLTR